MKPAEAVELIRDAVPRPGGTWADLGAGDGTFTRALAALLGPDSHLYAIDRDARALATLARWAKTANAGVTVATADFAKPFAAPWPGPLDGMLFANALHFVRDGGQVLGRLAAHLRPGGRVVLIEYDRRAANPWVPHPIPISALPALAAAAGLGVPKVLATRPSRYGGDLYVAVTDRP